MANRTPADRVIGRILRIADSIKLKLRLLVLRARGAQIGPGAEVGSVFLKRPFATTIGAACRIEDAVVFGHNGAWEGEAEIVIGDRTFVGHGTQLNIGGKLWIGSDCMIAAGCIVTDIEHEFSDTSIPMNKQPVKYISVKLNDNVWLGSGCIILSGVEVGEGAIIAAGAVVTKSVPPNEVWGGVPAKRLKVR